MYTVNELGFVEGKDLRAVNCCRVFLSLALACFLLLQYFSLVRFPPL